MVRIEETHDDVSHHDNHGDDGDNMDGVAAALENVNIAFSNRIANGGVSVK